MGMAAAAWDVLAKTANVAQMFAMLVAVFTILLRVQQSYKRQCAELERCIRRLRSLLQWPATGALFCSEMGGPVIMALGDAARLVESYKKSTLWGRVLSGGRMAAQLRDMQDVIDSYCGLLLFINAHIQLQQQEVQRHQPLPPSSDTSSTTIPEVDDDTSQRPSAQARNDQKANEGRIDTDTSQRPSAQARNDQKANEGGIDTDPAGCESNVPTLLPIVISHA